MHRTRAVASVNVSVSVFRGCDMRSEWCCCAKYFDLKCPCFACFVMYIVNVKCAALVMSSWVQ